MKENISDASIKRGTAQGIGKKNQGNRVKHIMVAFVTGVAMMATMGQNVVQAAAPIPTQLTGEIIDTSKTGSITIHKYEYNKTAGSTGTGAADDNVPADATPLKDVGFTIYKVENADKLNDYYAMSPTALPSASDYYDETDGKYTIKSAYSATKVGTEKVTDDAGIVAFDTLDLGIYLVMETTKPDKITTPITPFLVSVPMTTSDGADWMYDVNVYPKNKTTYGGIKLKKASKDGTALEGVTFVLQKKDTATGKYTTVKTDDKGNAIGTDGTLTTASTGILEVSDLAPGDYRFIETGIGTNYGYIMDGATSYSFTIGAGGVAAYGSTPTVDVAGEKYISVINEKPDVTKEVMKKGTATKTNEADYSVGDTISYRVTLKVPSNIGALRTFKLQDAPTHIKYTSGSIKMYQDGDETTEILAGKYTVDATTPANGFTATFDTTDTDGIQKYAGKTIIVVYDAVLQAGAVTTKEGNSNTIDLIYEDKINPENGTADGNPNPTKKPDNTDITTSEIEDSTIVYSFKLTIQKTGDSNVPLSGVKFDLYKEVTAGTAGAITGTAASGVGLDASKSWLKIETLTTAVDGTVSPTEGLSNGEYYLVETETNAGYNLLSKPVKVKLAATYSTSFKAASTGEHKIVKNEIDTASNTITEKLYINDDAAGQDTFTVNVKNSKGFTLPTTGGAGGFLFTVVGCGIMIVGIVILRKTSKKKIQ